MSLPREVEKKSPIDPTRSLPPAVHTVISPIAASLNGSSSPVGSSILRFLRRHLPELHLLKSGDHCPLLIARQCFRNSTRHVPVQTRHRRPRSQPQAIVVAAPKVTRCDRVVSCAVPWKR